ncbi:uncharacterized protein [Haliotis cracherodii]|uniref:uncharacterized protein n=1 Tax=Haliotis cracherodii TaxID=6455 RepID=UPI0039EAD736
MCAMFFRLKKPGKDEKIVTRPVGVRDKSGKAYITCCWEVEFGHQKVAIKFSRDSMCVYLDDDPVQTEMLIKDKGYDVHIWWENHLGNFYIFSDVDVDKSDKPMVNYLYINDKLVSKKNYKEHKKRQLVPEIPKKPIDIYLAECQMEQQEQSSK